MASPRARPAAAVHLRRTNGDTSLVPVTRDTSAQPNGRAVNGATTYTLTLSPLEVAELWERWSRTSGYAPVTGHDAHGTALGQRIEALAKAGRR